MLILAKNCTNNPPIVANNDKGMFDWDTTLMNKSYSTTIKYW